MENRWKINLANLFKIPDSHSTNMKFDLSNLKCIYSQANVQLIHLVGKVGTVTDVSLEFSLHLKK